MKIVQGTAKKKFEESETWQGHQNCKSLQCFCILDNILNPFTLQTPSGPRNAVLRALFHDNKLLIKVIIILTIYLQ
jgi:hypothetical protein